MRTNQPSQDTAQGETSLPPLVLERIVSGGQTGADRAALDWAIERGWPHGGWCPQGRWAEDGPIPERYVLQCTPSADPAERTEWNVRDSDATVIFSLAADLSGGSAYTAEMAAKHHKPCLHLSRALHAPRAAWMLRTFVRIHAVRILNVAGPRASREPDVGAFVREVLEAAFGPCPTSRSARETGPSSRARRATGA